MYSWNDSTPRTGMPVRVPKLSITCMSSSPHQEYNESGSYPIEGGLPCLQKCKNLAHDLLCPTYIPTPHVGPYGFARNRLPAPEFPRLRANSALEVSCRVNCFCRAKRVSSRRPELGNYRHLKQPVPHDWRRCNGILTRAPTSFCLIRLPRVAHMDGIFLLCLLCPPTN